MPRNVIITGATAGLGLALTKRLIESGDFVYGISKTKKHWKSAREQTRQSDHFFLYQTNLSIESNARQVISKIYKKAKQIDILINNAGYGNGLATVDKTSLCEFRKNIEGNLISCFLTSKYVIPQMKKTNFGLIINISSMAGKRAVPRVAAYSASKFGVVALSQAIAKENMDANLKCFTVCPGGMNTDMRIKFFGKEDAAKQQSPEFVADVIMKTISGEIQVDSGGDIVIRHGKITAINPVPPP